MPVDDDGTSRVIRKEIPLSINANIDVLFVVDNSPSMAPFATKLATNVRELIQALAPIGGPDLHLGVITTDSARLRTSAMVAGDFITTELQFDGTVLTNVSGSLEAAFVSLATVDSSGSSTPQPLALAAEALDGNPDFVRRDAFLAVIVITANDDASSGTSASFAAGLKQRQDDPSKVIVGAAFGPCTAGGLTANAAPRLAAFLDEFPNRNSRVSICDDNIDGAVDLTSQLVKTTLGLSCVESPLLDLDPAMSGVQPDCAVWLEHDGEQRVVEPCPSASVPCWSVIEQPQACVTQPSLAFRFEPATFRPVGDTLMEIECVAE